MNYPHTEYRSVEECIKKVYPALIFSFYNTNIDAKDNEEAIKTDNKALEVVPALSTHYMN